MPIVPQHATATADGSGDAVFMFPDVPRGELWCGTAQIPSAPATMVATVTTGGQLVGGMQGPGSYGPFIADASQRLAISATGLTPGTQYQAVWHADDKGESFSTYPGPITPTVLGAVTGTVDVANFPAVQTVDGSVDVGNFPAVQPISGAVTTTPTLATAVESGQVVMDGSADAFPNHAATDGVVLTAPATNAGPISVGTAGVTAGTGMILSPGQAPTPVLPVDNSNVFHAIGTTADVISFLVI